MKRGGRESRRAAGAVTHQLRWALPAIVLVLSVACTGGARTASERAPSPTMAPLAADAAPPVDVIRRRPPPPAVEASVIESPLRNDLPALRAPPAAASLAPVSAVPGSPRQGDARKSAGAPVSAEATRTRDNAPSVEALLADGLFLAGASPVHLAIRSTPGADSVRCAWRGTARTAEQRADAIRLWLGLEPDAAIPDAAYVEALFTAVLDTFDPAYRETAKANFLAIARGGESRDYQFLTCFADYAVSGFLLGTGTTPTTVTVAYDRMDEAASYDLYVREHDSGTYGSAPLQTRGEYEAVRQAQVIAAEDALRAEIGGRDSVVFLAPMGAHNAIGFEAWQAVAQ